MIGSERFLMNGESAAEERLRSPVIPLFAEQSCAADDEIQGIGREILA